MPNHFLPYASISLLCGLILLFSGCAGQQPASSRAEGPVSQREVEIRLDLADAYLRNNEPRLGLQELLRIQESAKALPRFHFTLGYTQFMLGNWSAAAQAFQKTLALEPSHAEAWNNLGLAHLAENRLDAAEAAFTGALGVPTYHTPEIAALNLALLHIERNDPDKARQYVNLALELNWRFSRAYLLAAEIEVGQGDVNAAIELLERGVAADLGNTRTMLTLSEYLLLAGRINDAQVWLERVLDVAGPESREAEMARQYLAAAHNRNGQPVTILEALPPADQFQDTRSAGGSPDDLPPASQHEPKPPLSSDVESKYIVQVGGFLDQNNAKALRDAYLDKAYPAGISEVRHKGKQWYLVTVGESSELQEARNMAQRFHARENVKAVVVRIGGGRYLEIESP